MKRTVRQNRYDNWYGYEGGKRVIAFGNSQTERAEDTARRWAAGDSTTSEEHAAADSEQAGENE